MSVEPNPSLRPASILMRLRALAKEGSRSPARLMLMGFSGVLLLATLFMTGTFTAISFIDGAAVGAERERAAVALQLVLADEAAAPDASTAARLERDFALRGARITQTGGLAPGEASIAIPGSAAVLAWMPRRFATEAFETVAPMRIGFAVLTVACIAFVMMRLNAVALDLEARRVLAQELASRDALTGLKNRLTFDRELWEAFTKGVRRDRQITLLYLDLDAFKSVNDTLGHLAGDELLRSAGDRLVTTVDAADSVARLGGDEFAVLRHGPVTRETLADLAVRIRTALSAPFPLEGTLVTIGVSIGIAVGPDMATTAEGLVRAADVALYRAKAEGGTHYAFAGISATGRAQRRNAA